MSSRPIARNVLERMLSQAGCVMRERPDGVIGLCTLDDPGSVTRNITAAEVLIDDSKMARWSHSRSSADNLITEIDIWYSPIIPLKDGYAGRKFCKRNGASGTTDNFLTEGETYSGYLENAYDLIGEDRPLQIKLDGVRDEATAEAFAKLWIKWRMRFLATLNLACKYSALDIELWDKIGVTATFLPATLSNRSWLVVGHRIVTNVGQTPEVNLALLELGVSNLPESEEWEEVGAAGLLKTEIGAGGPIYSEIGG